MKALIKWFHSQLKKIILLTTALKINHTDLLTKHMTRLKLKMMMTDLTLTGEIYILKCFLAMSRENVEFDDFRDANKCAEKFLKKIRFLAQFCMVFWLSCLEISKLQEKRSWTFLGRTFLINL